MLIKWFVAYGFAILIFIHGWAVSESITVHPKFNNKAENGRIRFQVEHIIPGESQGSLNSLRELMIQNYQKEEKYDEKGKNEIEEIIQHHAQGGTVTYSEEMFFQKNQVVMKEYSKSTINYFFDFKNKFEESLYIFPDKRDTLTRSTFINTVDRFYINWLGGIFDKLAESSEAQLSEDSIAGRLMISVPVEESLKPFLFNAERIEMILNPSTYDWEEIKLYRFNVNDKSLRFSDYQTNKGIRYPGLIVVERLTGKDKKDIIKMKVQDVEFNLPHLDVYGQMNIRKGKTTVIDERFSPSITYKIEESGDKKDEELVEIYNTRNKNQVINKHNINKSSEQNDKDKVRNNWKIVLQISVVLLIMLLIIWCFRKIRRNY
jgi:hypothetical protein